MLVEQLGITRENKLMIYENVSVREIKECAERVEEYCDRHQCIKGELQNDLLALKIMYRFTSYMNAFTYDWMPISHIEFREHIEREIGVIEDTILEDEDIVFVVG